ncbi:DUF1120 domain-containing protein [Enterobacter sp. V87_3]|uniref:DUF1120 domain-containing protein n=1 Tax=Enterobacter sp. V87_3 TaxID=3044236 RepID=UPI00249DCB48|nr:DUF1120 domain-containing protein [Enterobacter sp. V87_3]MDI3426023.1 DUF1120 domain-containing protein [Enterobacter sp. V87_3]HDS6850529.1 DUF1120 domain-containing protein [Enterobacter cancerogenus]
MKKLLVATAISMAMSVTAAHAADTAVLKVQGKLTNASCTPTLSNGGIVDYGTVYLGELSATTTNQLGDRDASLTITCSSPTKVAWSVVDDRADSATSNVNVKLGLITGYGAYPDTYGLGKTTGGVSIGTWGFYFPSDHVPTVDGNQARMIETNSSGTWQQASYTVDHRDYTMVSLSTATQGQASPDAFTEAVFPFKVSAAIDNTTRLAITDDTQLDGQATFILKYL